MAWSQVAQLGEVVAPLPSGGALWRFDPALGFPAPKCAGCDYSESLDHHFQNLRTTEPKS